MNILSRFSEIVANAFGAITVIEIGAHNGYHTNQMCTRLAARDYRYFAFEPDSRQLPYLLKAAEGRNVEVIECAVGAIDGVAPWYESDGVQTRPGEGQGQRFDGSSSLRVPTVHNATAFPEMTFRPDTAECVRLDTFAKQNRIGQVLWIWLDVQGSEVDIIEGGSNTLRNTMYLYTEYSNAPLYEGQISLDEILRRLKTFSIVEDYGGDVLLRNNSMTHAQ